MITVGPSTRIPVAGAPQQTSSGPGGFSAALDWRSRLEAEAGPGGVVVSWDPKPGPVDYRIMRSRVAALSDMADAEAGATGTVPLAPEEVGITAGSRFVDKTADLGQEYIYIVEARAAQSRRIATSNLAPYPSMAQLATFDTLADSVDALASRGRIDTAAQSAIGKEMDRAHRLVTDSELGESTKSLATLQQLLYAPDQNLMSQWEAEDLSRAVGRLQRRVQLVAEGLLVPEDLFGRRQME